MKAFVINLERRKDRYDYVMENYKSDNYTIEIVKAYDGKFPENNSSEYEQIKINLLQSIKNNQDKKEEYPYASFANFKKGEFGCFLSHVIIWKKMIDENIDKAIVYEDDCVFISDFNIKLENIISELPKEFNILWIGGKTFSNYQSDINQPISNYISIFNEKNPYGTFAYILSLEGAKLLYHYAFNIFRGRLGVDYFMFEFLRVNNNIQHTSIPHIAWSKIGNNEINTIFTTDVQNE